MYRIYTLLSALLFMSAAFCQSPVLVKDINANTADATSGSMPDNGFVLNGKLYFAATDYQGREPWKTDGTSANTTIIKDIVSSSPGLSSSPHSLVNFSGTIYFFIGDSANSQLWKIGADDSARFVMGGFTYPHDMVAAGNFIFFSGTIQGSGRGQELQKFDPVPATIQTFDINPGAAGSDPRYITVKRDSLFFSADDGTNGREFWIYDPISFNKVDMVLDINSGPDPSNPYDIVIYHDTAFFSANLGGPDGVEMVYTDGLVGGANTGFFTMNHQGAEADSSNPDHKTVFNDKLFFSATDGLAGNELWAYDGTGGNPFIFKDINTTAANANSNPGKYGFIQAGLFLYFAADNGINGNELWRTDGITGGTTALVQDINAGLASSDPQNMYHLGDTVIFTATTAAAGHQVWRAKFNTAALIQSIQPVASANLPNLFASYNNKIYFGADNGTSGVELYSTNGLTAGLVKDIYNEGWATSSNINWLEPFNSNMYFPATKNSLTEADGLYKSDGTFAGTVEVVAPGGATNFSVTQVPGKVAGSLLFFRGHNNAAGDELWKSDGTAAGTVLVKDISPGTNSSNVFSITRFGNKVLFLADDGVNGSELWISDGTSAGTFLLKNINANPGQGSFIDNITVSGPKAFFTAYDGINGFELWVTDGTSANTILVKDINPGVSGSSPGGLTAEGSGIIYFYANDGTNGFEPWKSDGTNAGTVLIKNINSGNLSSMNSGFCNFGGYSFFSADDGTGPKLWRTDGTTAGTTLFNSVAAPALITNIGAKMVFFSYPTTHPYGYELYNSDGTTVSKIKDFAPNSLDVLPDSFSVYLGKAFCYLDDNSHGQELFSTDGSPANSILYDIAPGAASSYPRSMKGVLNYVFFSAYDQTAKGNELWNLYAGTALPVSGLEFNVSKKDNTHALLDWKTYTELNDKGFEIERSANGSNFTDSLGFVNAKAVADNGATYQFIDMNPLSGRNYYRLKQRDFDGRFTYSPIRWIDFGKAVYVKIYPNPATDILNVNSSYNFKNAILNIHSSSGQLVRQQLINGSGTFTVPVKALPAGNYFIEISEGSSLTKLSFTKQ